MRFTIIGSRRSENTLDLIEAIEKAGHQSRTTLLSEIGFFSEDHSFRVIWNDISLLDETDIFLFRGFEKNFRLARILSRAALHAKKTIVDDAVATKDIANKASQAQLFQSAGLPHPKTLYTSSLEILETTLEHLGLPLIAKPIDGARGEDISLLKTKGEVLDFFKEHSRSHLFQEYLPIRSDIRIFIIGSKVLGAIRRHVLDSDIRSNASLGAKSEAIATTPAMEDIARQATATLGYEVSGVDLVETSSGYSILEVNHTPQWQAFKKATGINPAEHIVEYALKKHSGKSSLHSL